MAGFRAARRRAATCSLARGLPIPFAAVLHFATHAIVRDADPFGSLLVLSACRSAGGQVTGDGIATFARAFMYAGTPTLVASIWDVADQPTSQMPRSSLIDTLDERRFRNQQAHFADLTLRQFHLNTC